MESRKVVREKRKFRIFPFLMHNYRQKNPTMHCSIIHSTCQKTLLASGKTAASMMVSYTDFLIIETVSTGIPVLSNKIPVNNIMALLDTLMVLDTFNSDS